MALPVFQTNVRELSMMETQWSAQLNPLLANPTNNVSLLKNVALINGNTVVNHKLGQTMQGWFIVDINGAATIYRSAPLNDKTLTLNSSAAVTVTLGVF